jgi:predicted ferric reductase
VVKVDRPNARTLVVDLEPRAAPLRFVPGQFVYVDFANNGWHPHPFTIASGLSSPTLQLAIRDSGAETHALYHALQSGSTVRVGKPHGQFDYHGGGVHQVWVAAGIGITPFISWIRSLDDAFDHEVDFFYTVADEHDALFLKDIQAAAACYPSLRVHLVASGRDGLLTPEQIAKMVPSSLDQVWVYMCGPDAMMDSFAQRFRQLGVPRQRIFWNSSRCASPRSDRHGYAVALRPRSQCARTCLFMIPRRPCPGSRIVKPKVVEALYTFPERTTYCRQSILPLAICSLVYL